MPLIVINEDPIKSRHITWLTKPADSVGKIDLYEVVEEAYFHPDSDGQFLVPNIRVVHVSTLLISSPDGAAAFMLDRNLAVIDQMRKKPV